MFEVGQKICGTAESNSVYGVTNASMLLAKVKEIKEQDMIVTILAHIDKSKINMDFTVANKDSLFNLVPEEMEKQILESLEKEEEVDGWNTFSEIDYSREIRDKINGDNIHANGKLNHRVLFDMLVPFSLMSNQKSVTLSTYNSYVCTPGEEEGQAVALIGQIGSYETSGGIINVIDTANNKNVREKLLSILNNENSPWKKVGSLEEFEAEIYQNSVFKLEDATYDFSNQILIIANKVTEKMLIKFMPMWYEIYNYQWLEELNPAIEAYNQQLYIETLNSYYDKIVEERRRKEREEMFERFSEELPSIQTRGIENNLESIRNNIREYRNVLRDYLKREEEQKMKLFYLKNGRPSEAVQELKNYVESLGSSLKSIYVDNGTLTMCLEHPLAFYDEELWEVLRDNDDSIIYENDWVTSLLYDIFEYGKYELIFEQKLTVYLDNGSLEATRDFDYYVKNKNEGTTGIPNPHLYYYNCWGDYESIIRSMIEKYDFVMMISQIMASIGSLNLSDTPVMERFIESELVSSTFFDIPCIVDKKTGKRITIREYKKNNDISKITNNYYRKYEQLLTIETATEEQKELAKEAVAEYETLGQYAQRELETDYNLIKKLIEE